MQLPRHERHPGPLPGVVRAEFPAQWLGLIGLLQLS